MHQLLVVDPKWVEEANDSLKQKLMEKMSSAEEAVSSTTVGATATTGTAVEARIGASTDAGSS